MGERSLEQLVVTWARRAPARALRELVLMGGLGPLMDLYTRRQVLGRERFDGLEAPVVFVANHSSHMDTPAGTPIHPDGTEHRTEVMEQVRAFFEPPGADTTPAERSQLAGATST